MTIHLLEETYIDYNVVWQNRLYSFFENKLYYTI